MKNREHYEAQSLVTAMLAVAAERHFGRPEGWEESARWQADGIRSDKTLDHSLVALYCDDLWDRARTIFIFDDENDQVFDVAMIGLVNMTAAEYFTS